MLDAAFLIPAFPLLGFVAILFFGRKLGEPGAGWLATLAMGGSFASAVVVFFGLVNEPAEERRFVQTLWEWVPAGDFSVDVGFLVDPLSVTMTLFITGVGALIHLSSIAYMHGDKNFSKFFLYLNLFAFSMLMLVLGDNMLITFLGWEGVGACSYFLISFWFTDEANASAGKKAFVTNRIGDWGFMVAMFLTFTTIGSIQYVDLLGNASTLTQNTATAITVLLFVGAAGKSAQIPLYVWLPDAMAGPTPVSALIHAATMVTSGVYLLTRVNPVIAESAAWAPSMIAWVGAGTALFAATVAVAQNDIKKVLAYSTISQLGYMFVGVGVGAYAAGVFHLMTHAFFKALLFMGAGAVIHSMHKAYHTTHNHEDAQDMRNMGGLKKHMPITWITMWVATLAIAGIWPFAGFFSKDEIIWQIGAFGGAANAPYPALYTVYWIIALAAAMLTAFYMTRMMVMTFHGTNRTGEEEVKNLHEAPVVMWVPLAILAVLSLVGGWINVPPAIRESFLGLGPLTSEWLHHWLEPITAQAMHIQEANLGELSHSAPFGGGEVMWAIISTVLAMTVVFASVRFVGGQKVVPAKDSPEPAGFSKVLLNKYYVDEFYDRFIVQPIIRMSRFCWRVIDAGIIDGIVNGVGWTARGTGFVASMLQTGTVNTYAFILTVGVLVILGVSIF